MAKAFRTPTPTSRLAVPDDGAGRAGGLDIARDRQGLAGAEWNVHGQTCLAKAVSEASFAWHSTCPPRSVVPTHVHAEQDEFLYVLEGRFDILVDGAWHYATQADLVTLPRGVPHAIHNKSGHICRCLSWVAPRGRLPELFQAIHDLPRQSDEAIAELAAGHGVEFLRAGR